jgi:hypothetical protein
VDRNLSPKAIHGTLVSSQMASPDSQHHGHSSPMGHGIDSPGPGADHIIFRPWYGSNPMHLLCSRYCRLLDVAFIHRADAIDLRGSEARTPRQPYEAALDV